MPLYPGAEPADCPVVPITSGPLQHYFGYYDKPQFDPSGRFALGLAFDIPNRRQQAEDVATLGLIDLEDGFAWRPVAETRAWNWQFGCLAQWLPGGGGFIYSDRREGRFVSVLCDPSGRERGTLPAPVFALHPGGKSALGMNPARVAEIWPETGFRGVPDPNAGDPAPEDDGLFLLDLKTGELELIVSLKRLAEDDPHPFEPGAVSYVSHPQWNPDGSRIHFWWRARRRSDQSPSKRRLLTAAPDGSDLHVLHEGPSSHTAWADKEHVLAWATRAQGGKGHWLFEDKTGKAELAGEGRLTANGHFTFSPDGKWLLTDSPPDAEGERSILLYEWGTGRLVEACRFRPQPPPQFELRCDPHPRWHPDGKRVCIDSDHDGGRQMYLVDVSGVVG